MLKYLFARREQVLATEVPDGATTFTYHQKSALPALLSGFLLAAMVEAVGLHVILSYWSHWVAIVATLSTAVVALQIIGQIRAVTMRPIYYSNGCLTLRNGAFDLAEIPIHQIHQVESSSMTPGENANGENANGENANGENANGEKNALKPLHVSFPASHNVIIHLKEEAEATVLNRTQRKFKTALVAIDQPGELVELLRTEMLE